jgi:hypothetical protein
VSPFDQAREVYKREACARSFETDLHLHLAGGFVFSTPSYFVMGRPVDRWADPALIVNPAIAFPADSLNAWLVYLAGGSLSTMWDVLPWDYPWIGYEREDILRFTRLETIRRLSRK